MPTQKKILVVDDSKVAVDHLSALVAELGAYEIVGRASSGSQAVRLYHELRPDLVLMDIVMPDMDGIAALRSILAQDKAARVVMVTSMGGVGEKVAECLRLGAKGVLSKPFEAQGLKKVLEES